MFYIETSSVKSEKVIVKIYNLEGQVIYYSTYQTSEGVNQIEISDFHAAPGVYIMKLLSNEKTYSVKIVKE